MPASNRKRAFELMHAVLAPGIGLTTDRRMSHVLVADVPTYPRPLLLTDVALNIYPDLQAKRDIVQNAVDLAHVLGIEMPKVAILSAVETVNPKITSLHQPHNLAAIRGIAKSSPEIPQVACFDTAFHCTLPPVAQAFALPREVTDRGVRMLLRICDLLVIFLTCFVR